ncbi:MAG: glyoxylate/hydroxypyruvate reductase A [Gammaproteobacteria bacterium]|nr:glyoxylate/hydroxypyruvate reductase A [Gammaproteobacteria bacterium]
MSIILRVPPANAKWWRGCLSALLPEHALRLWHDPGNDDDIRYAVVWRPPPGGLKRFRHLECIVSIGAGTDHVFADPELPPGIPIIRTVGEPLKMRMREYVTLQVLRLHRRFDRLEQAHAEGRWAPITERPADQRRVGIMGLGAMGAPCAEALANLGFDVAGWARRAKTLAGVHCYAGPDGFKVLLKRSDILVNLLPLTPATENILRAEHFAYLPHGACLVNAARGEHLVEQDLLDALEQGVLDRAVLDVFRQEPLPAGHPFWTHPAIMVTPHVASLIDPASGATLIAQNLRRFIAGEPVPYRVDPERGY